jgi:4-amino-4-deoxy-L-arabinose transferase-like glycosyltransferase
MREPIQSSAAMAPVEIERVPDVHVPPPTNPCEWDWAAIRTQQPIATPRPLSKIIAAPLLVSVLVLPLLFEHLGRPAFNDTEVPFAQVAREMRSAGDWIMPTLLGIPRLDKPPLMYWLVAAGQALVGDGEGVARLWGVLATWGTLLVLWALARDTGQRPWLAPLVFGVSLGPQLFGRQVFLDPLMTFWMSLALLGYRRAYHGRPRWAVLLYAALGFAALTKGLVAIGLPCATIVLHMAITREWPTGLRGRWLIGGVALTVAIALPWYALMSIRRPDFPYYFFFREHVMRFTGTRWPPDEFLPAWAFLAITWAWTLPWAGLVPLAVWRAVRAGWEKRLRLAPDLLAVVWAGVVITLFSLSRSRLEYYALSAIPALALLVARLWDDACQPEATALRRKLQCCLAGTATGFLGAACAAELLLGSWSANIMNIGRRWWPTGWPRDLATEHAVLTQLHAPAVATLAACAVLLAVAAVTVRRWVRLSVALMTVMMIPFLILAHWGFALMEPFRTDRETAALVRQLARPGTEVILDEPHEFMWIAGVVYYGGAAPDYVVALRPGSLVRQEPAERFVSREALRARWDSSAPTLAITDANSPLMTNLLARGGRVAGRTAQQVVLENRAWR